MTGTPAQIGLAFETVTLSTEDGITIKGWYLPAAKERGTILFFHGNAGNIAHRLDSLRLFHSLGLSSFIIDYRGYGHSQGHPTEVGTYQDAQAAWHYLTQQRQIPGRKIIVFGRSLGGAIASQLAAHTQPGALIVESAFTSIPDLAAELYPFLPTRWLVRFQYPTENFLQKATCPVLIIHSRDDEIIPFAHGQALFKAALLPKQLLVLNGNHNDAFLVSERAYLQGIDAFLQTYFDQYWSVK
ncbi:alpha/beta hydrolase [Nitrosococcus oceani]|uniref:alpha/beta hydrolase n=1 Tax=Nitrosococcus oceani TaxID=1229 RepID=UPI003F6651D3